mgnify:CR=1 FL=1
MCCDFERYFLTFCKICFYELANYNGQRTCFEDDGVSFIGDTLSGSFSSIKLPEGTSVLLFAGKDYTDQSIRINEDTADLGELDFDDVVQSFQFGEYTPEDFGELCFYEKAAFEGNQTFENYLMLL